VRRKWEKNVQEIDRNEWRVGEKDRDWREAGTRWFLPQSMTDPSWRMGSNVQITFSFSIAVSLEICDGDKMNCLGLKPAVVAAFFTKIYLNGDERGKNLRIDVF
jgi:hypothetical protein